MFKRLLQYRELKKVKIPLTDLFEMIRTIRSNSDVIAFTPAVTGYNWMGVNTATRALFPLCTLELPQVFSNSVYNNHELTEISDFIVNQKFSQVILSGFPPYFESLAVHLHEHKIKVGCIYHGFLSEYGQNNFNSNAFKTLLRLTKSGVIAKLACIKNGLPEVIEKLTDLKVYSITLPTKSGEYSVRETLIKKPGEVHIGVLGNDNFRKNIHNQVAAALMVDNSVVHVSGNPNLSYWDCGQRIVFHPKTMPHSEYVNLLGQMDINLHLSFSESWGQVTAESLSAGVPCLIAKHSGIYDYDEFLKMKLVSQNFDDAYALSFEIVSLLKEREQLSEKCRAYISVLNNKAGELLFNFLAG